MRRWIISPAAAAWSPPAGSRSGSSSSSWPRSSIPGTRRSRSCSSSVRTQLRTKIAVAREGKTELETLIARARDLPAPGLDLPAGVRLPSTLTFRDASSRDVYAALARFANVNIVFDPQFRDQPITIDLRDTTLEDALISLNAATRNFYRVTAQRTVTIIPDTPAKRTEYEEEIVRTFYLSNADLKETIDLLRIVIDARRIAPIAATNAFSLKDTPERVTAAARLISAIDKAQARSRHRRRAARGRSHAAAGVRASDRLTRRQRASSARSTSTATA